MIVRVDVVRKLAALFVVSQVTGLANLDSEELTEAHPNIDEVLAALQIIPESTLEPLCYGETLENVLALVGIIALDEYLDELSMRI